MYWFQITDAFKVMVCAWLSDDHQEAYAVILSRYEYWSNVNWAWDRGIGTRLIRIPSLIFAKN